MNFENQINILFVLPNFDAGTSEKLVVDLIRKLNKNRFNTVVCVFSGGLYANSLRELGIPFYEVNEGGLIKSKGECIKFLNGIIRKHKISVVNTHHTSVLLQGLLSFKLFNWTRLIHTEHLRLKSIPNNASRITILDRLLMKFIDAAFGDSQEVCVYIHKDLGVSRNKINKILYGVEIERFRSSPEQARKNREEYRKKLGIDNEDIVIGMFAEFRKQKNHELLVRALKILKKEEHQHIKVVFAGDGQEREKIEQLVSDLDLSSCILSLGMRNDIPELMNMIDIYCLPSFYEELPLSLIEAMASGLPCVATNVDGSRDIIYNSQNGILVESDDPELLANALQKLISNKDLREILGIRAAVDVKEFSFEHLVKKYEDLFLDYGNK